MDEIPRLKSYKEFREDFYNKPVYTKAQMKDALEEQAAKFIVNRVILQGKDDDVALSIVRVFKTEEGNTVIVKMG
jgi:hypothetical protein